MPDQRSVMTEYRKLDAKRLSQGLTPAEQARLEKLKVLVGPEVGAGPAPAKAGFDVNAAAAALRESLLPAGLRNRPPPTPVQAPPPLAPEPEPAQPSLADALASEYAESPFAPLHDPAAEPQDSLFDPSSLGTEPPPAYPADAAYDPNAPQEGWDPNQPWDPNAAAEAQPSDPAAYPADAAYDPNAPQQAWDPNQPWDPNAAAEAQPLDAGAVPTETGPYADAAYDAGAAPAWDANADAASLGEEPALPDVTNPLEDTTVVAAEEFTEIEPVPGEAAPPDGGSFTPGEGSEAAGWEAEPAQPAATLDAAFGEYDAGVEPFAPGTLGAEPPLDPSVLDANLAAGEDAGAEAAALPAADASGPGEYDDSAGFAAEPFDASAVPPDAPGLDLGSAQALETGWQPEAALDAGFELASGGSFGAGADAAAPEWAQASPPPPWEGAPPLDLVAPPAEPAPDDAASYELSPPPASESFGALPSSGGELFGAGEGDLAAPEGESLAEGSAAPELDFSQPDFSAGGDADDFDAGAPEAGLGLASQPGADAPQAEGVAAVPPLELGEPTPAEDGAPPFADAGAPSFEFPAEEPAEVAEPAPGELSGALATDTEPWDGAEVAPTEASEYDAAQTEPDLASLAALAPEAPEAAELDPLVEASEAAPAEPDPGALAAFPADDAETAVATSPDLTGFAEAAAAAVASESTDLAEVIEAPADVAAEDLAFDVAEEPTPDAALADAAAADFGVEPLPEAHAEAAAPPPEPVALAEGGEDGLAEPAADVDLSFELSGEPSAPQPPPAEPALALEPEAAPAPAHAAPGDDDIPTIDGEDILEEILEDAPAATPPQSLDFEPLDVIEPERPAVAVAPAPPAPVSAPALAAPPAAAVLAPPPRPPAMVPPPAPAAPAAAAPAVPTAAPPVDYSVPGSHRVVVHTVEGLVKRGALQDPALDAPTIALAPQPGGTPEEVPTEKVKAIFFMLAPGEKAPAAEGKRVRVTFQDGRQIAGFSPDYHDDGLGFFMIPADTKTNTGRIWVYRAAVRQVSVS